MTITETYQISPEWGTLSAPLLRKIAQPNGIAATPLHALHQLALHQFQQAPFPGRKNEDWKYTPLRELFATEFISPGRSSIDEKVLTRLKNVVDAICIVFVNGIYEPSLSDALPSGVRFGSFQDTIDDRSVQVYMEKIHSHLQSTTMSPFEAMNTGMTDPGVWLIIDRDLHLQRPIHFLHITAHTAEKPISASPYKLMGIGRNADVQILESFISSDRSKGVFTNSVNHILVENGAFLRHHRLQNESSESFHINMTRVFQESDSTYKSLAVELGSKLMRNNLTVIHKGMNLTSNLFGVFIANDRQHTDTQSFIDHAQPHCESNELYKGILDDYARGVFNGKIIVRPDAQKTNAFQQNNTLILSQHALMDSKPQLEIFADDVKCSHGATIGQLDESALFYLRSRGLTRIEASSLLQRAFIGEVIDKCVNEDIKNYLNQNIEDHFHA